MALIFDLGAKCVVIKGGKGADEENAIDVIYDGKSFELLKSPKIQTTFTHGAGCTFSAAIASMLAKGADLHSALDTAKAFISAAIKHSFRLNQYVGPTCHSAYKEGL